MGGEKAPARVARCFLILSASCASSALRARFQRAGRASRAALLFQNRE